MMATPSAQEILTLVLSGLAQPALFQKINLAACYPVSSLSRLQASTPMKALTALCADAGLDPRVGFNQGSGDVSISVVIPHMEQYTGTGMYVGVSQYLEMHARRRSATISAVVFTIGHLGSRQAVSPFSG